MREKMARADAAVRQRALVYAFGGVAAPLYDARDADTRIAAKDARA